MKINKHTIEVIKPTTFVELVFPLLLEKVSISENLCESKLVDVIVFDII